MPLSLGIASSAGSLKNPAEPIALGYRYNHILNPSFEVDTSGWGSVGGATLARTTSEYNTGTACLEVTNSSGSAAQTTNRMAFLGGQGTYIVSAYIKLASGATTANYYLRHLQYENSDSSGTVSSGNVGTTSLSYTGNWVRLSGTFTRNAIANFFVIRVATSSSTPGDIFYVDSVLVEKGSALGSYFDGSSNGFWTGTPHASGSGGSPY